METPQLDYWTGYWGDKYLEANDYPPETFVPYCARYWKEILSHTKDVGSLVEVGCNIGQNLSVIDSIDKKINLTGVEPFGRAVEVARKRLPEASIVQGNGFELPFESSSFDMSASLGVMIHIAADHLYAFIDELERVSKRYVLVCEYQIEGDNQMCKSRPDLKEYVWRRNYKKIVSNSFGLQPIAEGRWWDENAIWYLFDKQDE